jgi:hypothetical protein
VQNKKKFILFFTTASLTFSILLAAGWVLITQFSENYSTDTPIAYIRSWEGEVFIFRNDRPLNLEPDLALIKFDKLVTGGNSLLNIELPNKSLISLQANSEAILKFWDNSSNSLPIYFIVNKGDARVLKESQKNELVVEIPHFERSDEPTLSMPELKIVKSNEESQEEYNEDSEFVETKPGMVSTLNSQEYNLVTLTNKEITETIKSYMSQLQKCQLNAYNSDQGATGSLSVTFSILPLGKTDAVQIQSQNIHSEQMINCIKSVFERINFPQFKGPTIAVNYPMIFE